MKISHKNTRQDDKDQNKVTKIRQKDQHKVTKHTIYYKTKRTKTRQQIQKHSHKDTIHYTVLYIIVAVRSHCTTQYSTLPLRCTGVSSESQ